MPETLMHLGFFDDLIEEDRAGVTRRQSPHSPQMRDLMVAVFCSAAKDCFTGGEKQMKQARRHLRDWIYGVDAEYLFSLVGVCDALGVSFQHAKVLLLRIANGEAVEDEVKEIIKQLRGLKTKKTLIKSRIAAPRPPRAGEQGARRERQRRVAVRNNKA